MSTWEEVLLQDDPLDEPNLEELESRDFLILALDALLCSSDGGRSLEGVQRLLLQKLTTSLRKDFIAVLFYNTRESENDWELPGLHVLHQGQPTVHLIKELTNLQNDEYFNGKIGKSNNLAQLGNVFYAARKLLQNPAWKVSSGGYQRLFLLTGQDDPHAEWSEKRVRFATIQRAQDFVMSGGQLTLFVPDATFDLDKFYHPCFSNIAMLLGTGDASQGDVFQVFQLDELDEKIKSKEFLKRAVWRLTLSFPEGELMMGLLGYLLVKSQGLPDFQNVCMASEQIEPVQAETVLINSVTAESLEQNQALRYYYQYGGRNVFFTQEELARIKCPFDQNTGIRIMGFLPRKSIQIFPYHIGSSYFVHADEREYPGSITACLALGKSLEEQELVALCSFLPRKKSLLRLALLYPASREEDVFGFHLVVLPFADEIRDLSLPSATATMLEAEGGNELRGVARKILDGYDSVEMHEYDADRFDNVKLQKFYALLTTLALEAEENLADTRNFSTEPKIKLDSELVKEFQQILGNCFSKKRGIMQEEEEEEWRRIEAFVQNDQITRLTKGDLQKWLCRHSTTAIDKTLNKAQLVILVKEVKNNKGSI